jgi:hypothetical protein
MIKWTVYMERVFGKYLWRNTVGKLSTLVKSPQNDRYLCCTDGEQIYESVGALE